MLTVSFSHLKKKKISHKHPFNILNLNKKNYYNFMDYYFYVPISYKFRALIKKVIKLLKL